MGDHPASKKPWYWVIGAGAIAALAFIANATGVFSFVTGFGSLPEILRPPVLGVEEPPRDTAPSNPQYESAEPVSLNSIVLPQNVFGYDTFGHETRQSHTLYSDEVSGAYAYGYWQDPDGIWADATAASGDGVAAIQQKLEEASAVGQLVKEFGSETCVWRQDSDPNTPRHEVWCFRIDEDRGMGMIVATHTAEVGEISPATFANEVWNLTLVG